MMPSDEIMNIELIEKDEGERERDQNEQTCLKLPNVRELGACHERTNATADFIEWTIFSLLQLNNKNLI